MRKILAVAAVLTLAACGSGQEQAPAPELAGALEQSESTVPAPAEYEAILNEAFVLAGGSETPADEVIALLPDSMELTIGNSSFDAASGATIWTDVSLTGADGSGMGLTADELKLWGLNTDGIAARVAGENFGETVKFADRIEAKGLKTQGLETLFADFMAGYIEGISQTIETVIPEEGMSEEQLAEMRADMEMVFDEYSFSMERLVVVAPRMRPWEIARIDPAIIETEEDKAVLIALQDLAAYARTAGADHMIATNTDFVMTTDQDGIKQDVEGVYAFTAYSGWNGGDLDTSLVTGARFFSDMDMTDAMVEDGLSVEDVPEAFQQMRLEYAAEQGSFSGMKFDKVLRYLALGEWPPLTDTDLMAYGRAELSGFDMSLNDAELISMDRFVLDLTDWHWAIPSKAELSVTELTYNVEGILDLFLSVPEAQDVEEIELVKQAVDIGKRYEAFPVIYDAALKWDWNPETGAFSFSAPQKHHTFGQAEFELSGFLPNFEDSVEAMMADLAYEPAPDADLYEEIFRETAWETLVEEKFSVTGGLLVLDDQGGLDKIFALIVEIGKLNPDEAGPMIANSTPDALRQAAVSGIGFAAIQAGKETPIAENWIMPLADWVRDGGKFTIKLDPSEPLGAHLEEKYPDPDPDEIAEILGITVTHDAP